MKRISYHLKRGVDLAKGRVSLKERIEQSRSGKGRGKRGSDIERLPPELRRRILSALPYESLKALVLASPTYYSQYQIDRKFLLRGLIRSMFGDVLVDAHTAYSTIDDLTRHECIEDVLVYLADYTTSLHSSATRIQMETEIMNDVEHMACLVGFHVNYVQPIMTLFVTWAMKNLASGFQEYRKVELPNGISLSLSQSEELRVARAIYRYQLCCSIFGAARLQTHCRRFPRGLSGQDLVTFLFMYEPWEAEEMVCFYEFVQTVYDKVFQDIEKDIEKDYQSNPRRGIGITFRHRRKYSSDSSLLNNAYLLTRPKVNRAFILKGTASRGLKLLHLVKFKIQNQKHLVSVIMKDFIIDPGDFLNLEPWETCFRRVLQRTGNWTELQLESIQKQERREVMVFEGDDYKRPPYAWTVLWKGTYSVYFGGRCIPDWYRDWGYVFWDMRRLKTVRGENFLSPIENGQVGDILYPLLEDPR